MPKPPPIDAELIAHASAGTLVEVLRREADADREDSLVNRLVALHNGGQLDLLAATQTPAFDALGGPIFFSVQSVFCAAIPKLTSPVSAVMAAVAKLVEKGGRDGASGFPYNSFKAWIDVDTARARQIIASADSGGAIDKTFLAIALEAEGAMTEVNRLIALGGESRLAAIGALGRINPADSAGEKAALAVLLPYCEAGFDEDVRYAAINAVFALLRTAPSLAPTAVPTVIAAVGAKPTLDCLFAAVQALWLQDKLFDRSSVAALLTLARASDFTKKGLVDVLDGALRHMLGTPERDLALDFLTGVLAQQDGPTLEALDGVSHHLANEARATQFGLAVRWFLTANRHLCEAMAHILTSARERDDPFDASMAGMGLTGSQLVVVCHKAIGFMMLQPVVSGSVVVAALRAGDPSVEDQLTDLLIHPILINFGDAARGYLAGIKKGDAAYKTVKKALKQGDAYFKGTKIDTPIKELWPSDYQRNLANMKRYDLGRQIRKMADEKSIFAKLVSRSTLLYGHKSMNFVGGPGKPPVTMELKPMGVEMAMPRLDLIDPVGLDWLLRIYRSSTPK
jgi:hypothetical protein